MPGGGPSGPSGAAISQARSTADAIARAVAAHTVLPLEVASDPNPPAGSLPGDSLASLIHPMTYQGHKGFSLVTTPLVATPAILDFYRIPTGAVGAKTDILTARTDLSGRELGTAATGSFRPATIQVNKQLPDYTSAPNTLITEKAVHALGLAIRPAGWLLQTPHPLTSAQLADARHKAAAAGITIETRTAPDDSMQQLREYATIAGLLVELGVLAMTVGLIRSETANDLRTLAATGASGAARRTLAAATAGALGLLGGILGTAAAYLALVAWHWRDVSYLGAPPYLDVIVLVLGLPVAGALGGWLLGRTPTGISRSPLE